MIGVNQSQRGRGAGEDDQIHGPAEAIAGQSQVGRTGRVVAPRNADDERGEQAQDEPDLHDRRGAFATLRQISADHRRTPDRHQQHDHGTRSQQHFRREGAQQGAGGHQIAHRFTDIEGEA